MLFVRLGLVQVRCWPWVCFALRDQCNESYADASRSVIGRIDFAEVNNLMLECQIVTNDGECDRGQGKEWGIDWP